MRHESVVNEDWTNVVARLGGAETLKVTAREAKAFLRPREITNAVDLLHSAFDLPQERFGHFELTDQQAGERLDRIPVVKGEIRLGDRAYLQPNRMAAVIEAGADLVIRAGWKSACWLDDEGEAFDLVAELRKAAGRGLIDRPIWIKRK